MKRTMTFIAALLAASVLLVACGGQANAAALPFNFTASDGTNFSIDHAASVQKSTNGITVTRKAVNADGTTVLVSKGYPDAGGAVWSGKVVPAMTGSGLFLRVGTTDRYIGAQAVQDVVCFGSTTILYYGGGTTEANDSVSDGCAVWQGIKALSN